MKSVAKHSFLETGGETGRPRTCYSLHRTSSRHFVFAAKRVHFIYKSYGGVVQEEVELSEGGYTTTQIEGGYIVKEVI